LATAFAITPVDIDLCGLTTAPSMDAGADNAFGQMLQSAQTAVPNIASADVAEGHMINALQVGQCAAEPSRAWAGAAFASHRAARLTVDKRDGAVESVERCVTRKPTAEVTSGATETPGCLATETSAGTPAARFLFATDDVLAPGLAVLGHKLRATPRRPAQVDGASDGRSPPRSAESGWQSSSPARSVPPTPDDSPLAPVPPIWNPALVTPLPTAPADISSSPTPIAPALLGSAVANTRGSALPVAPASTACPVTGAAPAYSSDPVMPASGVFVDGERTSNRPSGVSTSVGGTLSVRPAPYPPAGGAINIVEGFPTLTTTEAAATPSLTSIDARAPTVPATDAESGEASVVTQPLTTDNPTVRAAKKFATGPWLFTTQVPLRAPAERSFTLAQVHTWADLPASAPAEVGIPDRDDVAPLATNRTPIVSIGTEPELTACEPEQVTPAAPCEVGSEPDERSGFAAATSETRSSGRAETGAAPLPGRGVTLPRETINVAVGSDSPEWAVTPAISVAIPSNPDVTAAIFETSASSPPPSNVSTFRALAVTAKSAIAVTSRGGPPGVTTIDALGESPAAPMAVNLDAFSRESSTIRLSHSRLINSLGMSERSRSMGTVTSEAVGRTPATAYRKNGQHLAEGIASRTSSAVGDEAQVEQTVLAPPPSAAYEITLPTAPASQPLHRAPSAQVARALITLVKTTEGSRQLTIQLHPGELGMVQIRLERRASSATQVTIVADRSATLQLLQRDQLSLHRTLDEAGVPSAGRVITFHSAESATALGATVPGYSSGTNASAGDPASVGADSTAAGERGSDHPARAADRTPSRRRRGVISGLSDKKAFGGLPTHHVGLDITA
jgi:flagellar hook-length control protein FliK